MSETDLTTPQPDTGPATGPGSCCFLCGPMQVILVVRFLNMDSLPTDDETFLRILRAEPENEEARLGYWNWLEETGDARAPFSFVE